MIFSGINKIKNVFSGNQEVKKVIQNNIEIWKKEEEEAGDYLCFERLGTDSRVWLECEGTPGFDCNVEYSTDGINFTPFVLHTQITVPNIGDKVYFRACEEGNYKLGKDTSNYYYFKTGECDYVKTVPQWRVTGDVTTILDRKGNVLDLSGRDYCFGYMFKLICSEIYIKLPSTTLAPYCYRNMFQRCRNSIFPNGIDLMADTLTTYCYTYMFQSTSIGCVRLRNTSWTYNQASYWLENSPNEKGIGVLGCPAELGNNETITRGTGFCPNNWTIINYVDSTSASDFTGIGIKDKIYNGNPHTQSGYKFFDGLAIPLTEGTDYTVTYTDNTEIGTAHMIITGLGKYSGTKTIDFIINSPDIQECTITLESQIYPYSGSAISAKVTVVNKLGDTLTENTDYTVSYTDNTEIGTGTVTVTGKGIYINSKTVGFSIKDESLLTKVQRSTGTSYYEISGICNYFDIGRARSDVSTNIQILKPSANVTGLGNNVLWNEGGKFRTLDLTNYTDPDNIPTVDSKFCFPYNYSSWKINVANEEMLNAFVNSGTVWQTEFASRFQVATE